MPAARWFQGDLVPYGGQAAGLSLWAGLRREGDCLHLRFELQGRIDTVLVPSPAAAPARRDGLWQHTCFEAFVARRESAEYTEINLSPSGDWACYRFERYRAGQANATLPQAPCITGTQPSADTFTLDAQVDLPAFSAPVGLDVGLSAVIERRDGSKTYWALAHPGDKPDFHLRDGFTLRME